MPEVTTPEESGKILRGCRAFWLSFDGENWTCLGADDDDLSIETNPDSQNFTNVQGRTRVEINNYAPSLSNENYIARKEDAIYPHLQEIANTLTTADSKITATLLVATLTDEVYKADTETLAGTGFQTKAKVVVTGDGGGTSGYQIPYTVTEEGGRTQGTVSVTGGKPTFTPLASAEKAAMRSARLAAGGPESGSLSD